MEITWGSLLLYCLGIILVLDVTIGQHDLETEDHVSLCDSQNVQRCAASVQNMHNKAAVGKGDSDFMLTNNNEELRLVCENTQEALRCINNYVNECLDQYHRSLYIDLTSGLQEFIHNFCDEGSTFSKDYRRHLSCYNNLTSEFKRCSEFLNKAEKEMEVMKLPTKEAAKHICCNYDQTVNCFRNTALDHCSVEAADFVEEIFEKLLLNATRLLLCDQYTFEDPECGLPVSTSINWKTHKWLWFLTVLVLIETNREN